MPAQNESNFNELLTLAHPGRLVGGAYAPSAWRRLLSSVKPLMSARTRFKTLKLVLRQPLTLASLFVSICALGLTVYQARTTDYHNRLSVLPQLQFSQVADPSGKSIEIFVENNGLGPARINGIEAYIVDDFVRFESELDWSVLAPKLKAVGVSIAEATGTTFPLRTFIRAQEKVLLLRVPTSSPEEQTVVKAGLNKLSLGFCYCSLYGDCFHVAVKSRDQSNEGTCRYDGTVKLFGSRYRVKTPWAQSLDSSTTHGY